MTDKSNLKVCHETSTGNIITPEGVLFYAPYLIEAHENDQGKAKYNLELCFPPETDLKLLKNAMGKVALEKLKGDTEAAKKFVAKRFLDPVNLESGKSRGEKYKGWIMIRASSEYMPDFIHPNGKKCPAENLKTECYSGRWVRATVNPFWYDIGAKKGLSLGLQNVQMLKHGEPIGFVKPEGEDEFGAVEGVESGAIESAEAPKSSGESVDALFG